MKTKVIDHGEIKILEIIGKLTIGEGDIQMRKAVYDLLDRGSLKIIMDMGGLKYIDSSGIGELVSCYTSINNRGGQLRLANVRTKIYSLLQLTALVSVFQICDSVDDALKSFSQLSA